MTRPIRLATIVASLVLLGAPAVATTVRRLSYDQLIDGATWIVHGMVERVEARSVPGRPPFRLARVRVIESLAGEGGGIAWIRLPGGPDELGRVAHVPGVPELAEGDEIVAFLERVPPTSTRHVTVSPALDDPSRSHAARASGPQPPSQWIPMALAHGAWRVDRSLGEPRVLRDPQARGLRVAGDAVGEAPPEEASLPAMKARVRGRRGASR